MKRKIQTEIDRDMVLSQIKRLDLSKAYTIEITEKRVRRTISQNNLYWLWLTCLSFETGNDRMKLHEYFKDEFIPAELFEMFGKVKSLKSTTGLNTVQFKYLLDHVQQFASSELAITLPDPEDHKWEEFYKYYVDKL